MAYHKASSATLMGSELGGGKFGSWPEMAVNPRYNVGATPGVFSQKSPLLLLCYRNLATSTQ